MELIEHIAEYLRGQGFPTATSGILATEPDRTCAVYATGLRSATDIDGSRFQIIVRSERDVDTAIGDAMAINNLLDEFSGITSTDSPIILRIRADTGAASLGEDQQHRLLYSLNYTAWVCE